jgi:GNAT superfamily N-acetyltransferase
VNVRPLSPDFGWDEYIDLTMRSFGPMDGARVQPNIEPIVADGRCLGAYDGGRLVGTALYHDMRQWWHGRPVRMAGVAGVKVAPEYRGQGVGRAMMTALAELMTERGYPLSALYPATMPIYLAERESWMLRLLDAPAAIAARGFPATDLAVPLQITDDLRAANSGRWELTVRAGAGRLSRYRTGEVHAPADPACPGGQAPLALGARGLAALYAGTPVATLRRAGLAEGGSPAADAALDGAFAATPYMLDSF